ncbi:MAG: 50S ribosomal protein L3 N(5)-glutamine methyltransferase [Variovorax sp.]
MTTVLQMIHEGEEALVAAGVAFGHGTTNAFDEAAWLVLWRLGLPLGDLETVEQREVDAADRATIRKLLAERIESRRPAAYLTGEAWLQGVPFTIDERAIVPRSLIAEVIADGTLDAWLPAQATTLLDLCTGNANLAILAALAWPQLHVTASDISASALEVARLNLAKHDLASRIELCESDGFERLSGFPGRWDAILCNPPYVNAASMATLPPEFRAEPTLALAGGDDGMTLVRRILYDAAAHMTDDAVLVVEIGNERHHFDQAFARLEVVWLECSAGSDQVLLVTRTALMQYSH